ncbi:MAG: hypothetical protein NC089_03580 [Bacteroides sp.]|nr:hypothetical protein [Bacteroides sp.]MCM1549751.1 hypothetical protein [Clostridium sp.]
MEEKEETFTYNYSADDQAEIKKIREKYIPQEENKMEQLRRLDESATKPGMITALLIGIISTLVMGLGMCCTIVWAESMFIPGIIIGMVGIAGIVAAYPIYSHMTKKRREKLAPEIIRLTDELMK